MSNSRPLIFGEVLFDCFPDKSRILGGAPFNVAWHCHAFGLAPLFISRIGNDSLGNEVRSAMLEWGMDVSGLQLDSIHPTGIVDVHIDNGEPSYDIVENSAWDFIDQKSLPEINTQHLLYHGSLATRNPLAANALAVLREQCTNDIFIDVNLRTPWWNLHQLETMISTIRWLKLNIDELKLIVPFMSETESRVRYLMSTYNIELIVVTQGSAGAIAYGLEEVCLVKPEQTANVVDTVGAGDAFSSILLTGLHYAWPLQIILDRAQQFASAVVTLRGATTQDKQFYKPFIDNWSL